MELQVAFGSAVLTPSYWHVQVKYTEASEERLCPSTLGVDVSAWELRMHNALMCTWRDYRALSLLKYGGVKAPTRSRKSVWPSGQQGRPHRRPPPPPCPTKPSPCLVLLPVASNANSYERGCHRHDRHVTAPGRDLARLRCGSQRRIAPCVCRVPVQAAEQGLWTCSLDLASVGPRSLLVAACRAQ